MQKILKLKISDVIYTSNLASHYLFSVISFVWVMRFIHDQATDSDAEGNLSPTQWLLKYFDGLMDWLIDQLSIDRLIDWSPGMHLITVPSWDSLTNIRRGVYKSYTDNKLECVSMLFGSSPILPWKRKLPRWRMAAKRVKIIQLSSSENINTWTKTNINKCTFQMSRGNLPKRGEEFYRSASTVGRFSDDGQDKTRMLCPKYALPK